VFAHRASIPAARVGVAVTDRHGGVSAGPWASLNLGDHVGDDAAAVVENRARLRRALGSGVSTLAFMRQVHGDRVEVVDDGAGVPECDAVVTREPGVALVVLVADCTPILLWDTAAGVVAAVHAGRRGLAAGVLPATVTAMQRLGATPAAIGALVGPGICAEHYEVPAELRDEVADAVPTAAATTSKGTAAVDIRAGLVAQLDRCGVTPMAVLVECTRENDDLYSHRRDGRTGRFAGVVWLEP
jgi:YfiH family protein